MIKALMSPFFVFFLLLLFATVNVQASQLSGYLPVYSRFYDASRNPNADGRHALKLAKETNRKVLIEVGGDWCSWCFVLDRFIKEHPEVESRLHQTFVVLKVNISDENDNVDFMAAFPPAQGYPHMYVSDSNGNILSSQDTADFRENQKYSESRFMAFFDRWKNKSK
jgi:thiol:disulfide interchange protein